MKYTSQRETRDIFSFLKVLTRAVELGKGRVVEPKDQDIQRLMIDPKMVEFSIYDGIAHLLAPVVTDPKRAAITFKHWVIKEMERRYKIFHDSGVRNLQAYNNKVDVEENLPRIVVIIDELADLMMVAANEVETAL